MEENATGKVCEHPDGALGDIWRDENADDTWIHVKKCSESGNWVTINKELKVK